MAIIDRVYESMERGKSGGNVGVPFGKNWNRLSSAIPNIQKKTYYLIGGGPKAGKTAFADDLFLFGPYEELRRNNPNKLYVEWIYWSWEIDKESKITKAVARKMYHDHKIIVDTDHLLFKGKNWIPDDIYAKAREYREYFAQMEDYLYINDIPENPTGVKKFFDDYYEQNGTKIFKEFTASSGKKIKQFDHYIAHNPNLYTICVIDHAALTKTEKDLNLKESMDKLSQDLVALRNQYGLVVVFIQQLSFDTGSSDRFKQKRITPIIGDFGDTKYTTRDANYIMTVWNPEDYDLQEFEDYNVGKMRHRVRRIELLRSRESRGAQKIYANFCGENGCWREILIPSDIEKLGYNTENYYNKLLSFESL